jgi:diguanylate cyclase (GGDEF)-like protein/PAS domain S-box-containing protein
VNSRDHINSPGDSLEEELQGQLRFMRNLVDSAADAIIVHESDGTLVFYNTAARELLGRSDEQMAELAPFGWVGPGSHERAPTRLESILYEGKHVFESSVVTLDGTAVPTEVTASRFETESGPLVVAVIRDTHRRADTREQLEKLAYHDPLTGIANRAAFEERLNQAIADARRYGDLLILAYVDLDRFKPVNDVYGHAAGDEALIEVARRLADIIRGGDMVARLGGDEFVVLLRRVESIEQIGGIAERMVKTIRQPIAISSSTVEIDAAIGFAVFDPSTDDARSLVVKADVAMYESKRCSNCSWQIYEPYMGTINPNC